MASHSKCKIEDTGHFNLCNKKSDFIGISQPTSQLQGWGNCPIERGILHNLTSFENDTCIQGVLIPEKCYDFPSNKSKELKFEQITQISEPPFYSCPTSPNIQDKPIVIPVQHNYKTEGELEIGHPENSQTYEMQSNMYSPVSSYMDLPTQITCTLESNDLQGVTQNQTLNTFHNKSCQADLHISHDENSIPRVVLKGDLYSSKNHTPSTLLKPIDSPITHDSYNTICNPNQPASNQSYVPMFKKDIHTQSYSPLRVNPYNNETMYGDYQATVTLQNPQNRENMHYTYMYTSPKPQVQVASKSSCPIVDTNVFKSRVHVPSANNDNYHVQGVSKNSYSTNNMEFKGSLPDKQHQLPSSQNVLCDTAAYHQHSRLNQLPHINTDQRLINSPKHKGLLPESHIHIDSTFPLKLQPPIGKLNLQQ